MQTDYSARGIAESPPSCRQQEIAWNTVEYAEHRKPQIAPTVAHFLQHGHTHTNKATPPGSGNPYQIIGPSFIQTTTEYDLFNQLCNFICCYSMKLICSLLFFWHLHWFDIMGSGYLIKTSERFVFNIIEDFFPLIVWYKPPVKSSGLGLFFSDTVIDSTSLFNI